MTQVDISIDELDLSAVDPARRFQVAATFEVELARLVRGRAAADFRTGHDDSEPQTILIPPTANPVHLGVAIARSVFETLT